MSRERTFVVARCLNRHCPRRRDAEPGHMGYCSACGQAVRRRIKQGKYTKEELVAQGKIVQSQIDDWLSN